jgi:hypothetical protein
MLVQGRLPFRTFAHGVRCCGCVVVPVEMGNTSTVPVDVGVSRKHGDIAAQGRIEWIIQRVPIVLVVVSMTVIVAMTMLMLGEFSLVPMEVAAMLDRDRDLEAVRFGYLINGSPVGTVIGEQKILTRSVGAQRLDLDRIGMGAGQTEAWRDASFIN